MKLLEERIKRDGVFLGNDILKVDNFLNHLIDVELIDKMGEEWARLYEGEAINKILTIEASGIGLACIAARHFGNCPVLFAKKSKTSNIGEDFYTAKAYSFTHGNTNDIIVSKKYLGPDDRVLIIDDFLANGEALLALASICSKAGAKIVGVGIAIEKWYQGGGDKIRDMGIRVESLAKIKNLEGENIEFM